MRILNDTLQDERPTIVLQQMALMLERETMAVQPASSPNKITLLENVFDTVYKELQPTDLDYKAREDAVNFVNGLVRNKVSVGYIKQQFGLCHVGAFGSFTMDMFTPTSDLDISLNLEYGVENLLREEKIKILRRLTKCLYFLEHGGGYVRDIQPVLRAKVPVVKFVHCKTGIECDVSAENRDGIIKSDILRILSSIDWRFRKLCFLVKAWANGHGINNSKDGTLNSLSIILLVAFHLQTRTPAILPPFSIFLEGSPSPATLETISLVQNRVHKFQNFGRKNTESVVELFLSFIMQLVSVKELWQKGLCASTYEGTWTTASKASWMFVEDFTALTQNAARAVGEKGFDDVYKCLHETSRKFENYFRNLCDANTLKSLLFSPPVKTSVKRGKRHLDGDTDGVGNQRKAYKGVIEHRDVMHRMAEEPSIFSEIANWVAFEERPRHEVIGHDEILRNTQRLIPLPWASRAGQVTFEDTHALHSTTGSAILLRLQGEHPAKKFKAHEVIYENRHMHHLPTPNSMSARQHDRYSLSLTHRNLERSFGDELIQYDISVNSRLQDRQSLSATAAAPSGFREATLRAQLHQQRPTLQYTVRGGLPVTAHGSYSGNAGTHQLELLSPWLRTKASGPYDESIRPVYSSVYANPLSSYGSSEHKQYNRLYDSNM